MKYWNLNLVSRIFFQKKIYKILILIVVGLKNYPNNGFIISSNASQRETKPRS